MKQQSYDIVVEAANQCRLHLFKHHSVYQHGDKFTVIGGEEPITAKIFLKSVFFYDRLGYIFNVKKQYLYDLVIAQSDNSP